MPRRSWRRLLYIVVALAVAGASVLIWNRYDFEKLSLTWGVVGAAFGAFLVVRDVVKDRDAIRGTPSARRRDVTKALAEQVRSAASDDPVLKTLEEPYPLPVAWTNAPEDHQPSWRTICRSSDGERLDLSGRDDGIVGAYRKIPSGRMLVLGVAGSGKSVLVTRLARRLAAGTAAGGPIPVVLYVASWQVEKSTFDEWAVSQIAYRYSRLSLLHPRWPDVLREMLDGNEILPILDGLDEMAENQAVRCLRRLNELPARPLVLTSRSGFYRDYLRRGEKLRAAAVIMIQPLDPVKVAEYLADAAPFDQSARWRPVLQELTLGRRSQRGANGRAQVQTGESGAGENELAAALGTPLMVALARLAFTEREADGAPRSAPIDPPDDADAPDGAGAGARDPGVLVELARFGGREAVEDKLINAVVEVAIPPYQGGWLPKRWQPEKTRRYLSFLAGHLEAGHRREIVWWRLPQELPAAVWALFHGVRAVLAAWIVLALAGGVLRSVAAATDNTGLRDAMEFVTAHPNLLALGAAVPVIALVSFGDELPNRDSVPPVRIAFRGGLAAFVEGLLYGLFVGGFWAVALWVAVQLHRPVEGIVTFLEPYTLPVTSWSDDVRAAVTVGLLRAGYVAVRSALRVDFSTPAAWFTVTEPMRVFRADRAAALLSLLPAAAKSVIFTVLLFGALSLARLLPAVPVEASALAGLGLGVGWWLFVRLGGAWPRGVITRLVLALTGRLPYRLLEFLAAVESVGLLRDLGGAYRFRHERLQNLLLHLDGWPPSVRHQEAYATELARAGYWEEAFDIFDTVLAQRIGSFQTADKLLAAALRKAVFTGCALGKWRSIEKILLEVREAVPADEIPHAPAVAAKRRKISELVRRESPLERLLAACDELIEAESSAGWPDPASREFRVVLRYLCGDPAAGVPPSQLAEPSDTLEDWSHAIPVSAALLSRLALESGDPGAAMATGDRELLSAEMPSDPVDVARLAESWWWSVHTLARVGNGAAGWPPPMDRISTMEPSSGVDGRRPVLRDWVEAVLFLALHAALSAPLSHSLFGGFSVVVARTLVAIFRNPRRFWLTIELHTLVVAEREPR